jgi:hypothetical protein
MNMQKKSATDMPTATILWRRIVEWTITKKTISERIITGNNGMERQTVVEIDKKMEEI